MSIHATCSEHDYCRPASERCPGCDFDAGHRLIDPEPRGPDTPSMTKLVLGLDTLAHQVERMEVTEEITPDDARLLYVLIAATKLEAVRLMEIHPQPPPFERNRPEGTRKDP